MNILEKIDYIQEVASKVLNESGLRNMRELAKTHKEAEIYFHQDLDGVTSAIAIKNYLERYGIKVIDTHIVQYGDTEYAVPKPKPHTLHVMVDFAHGKSAIMHIHTDHHDKQVGVDKGTSTSFVKSPSNAAYISEIIPNSDAFPKEDLKVISMVDSADFAKNDITPDDVMRATFKLNKDIEVNKNRTYMGLVVNKLLLAYKNKKGFLEKLVILANPSLMSMYNTIVYLAKQAGYRPPDELQDAMDNYVDIQKSKIVKVDYTDIRSMKMGNSTEFGNVVYQYGAGALTSKDVLYDRYVVFKNHPDAEFLVIAWPLGLLQASKNPFKKSDIDIHLGELAKKVLQKYRSTFERKMISLEYIKNLFEKKATEVSMGFTFNDFISLFGDKIKGFGSDKWNEIVKDVTNKPYSKLSDNQKDILRKIKISAWDIIEAQSGGHKSITNISGLNFIGKGYTDVMKDIAKDIVKAINEIS